MSKHFSERENKVIKIIGRLGRESTLLEISSELFQNDEVMDREIKAANTVRRISQKCKYFKLKWKITKTRKYGKLYIKREKSCNIYLP